VLEQVLMQQFKNEDLVLMPEQVLFHSDNVVLVIRVLLHQLLQEFGLCCCEFMINLSIAINLYSDILL